MDERAWIDELVRAYRVQRSQCERAVAQVSDDRLFETPYRGAPSLAVLMKHVSGNLRSRMRDFLTSDGEKYDRQRDSEFDVSADTPASIQALWEEGWETALATLEALQPQDLDREVTIRGEPWQVTSALQRNLTHTAYHGGQIVMLAKHLAGSAWQTLSIPLGGSEAFNAEMRERFGGGAG